MIRASTYVFLRLFALTLGRSYRNSPDSACDDAIMLTGVVLTMPLLFLYVGIASLVPYIGEHIVGLASIFVVLLFVAPLMYLVNKKFTGFRRKPSEAAPYSNRYQRVTTFAVLVGLLMSAPIAFGLLFRQLLH